MLNVCKTSIKNFGISFHLVYTHVREWHSCAIFIKILFAVYYNSGNTGTGATGLRQEQYRAQEIKYNLLVLMSGSPSETAYLLFFLLIC